MARLNASKSATITAGSLNVVVIAFDNVNPDTAKITFAAVGAMNIGIVSKDIANNLNQACIVHRQVSGLPVYTTTPAKIINTPEFVATVSDITVAGTPQIQITPTLNTLSASVQVLAEVQGEAWAA